jgi:hypothetical protein
MFQRNYVRIHRAVILPFHIWQYQRTRRKLARMIAEAQAR